MANTQHTWEMVVQEELIEDMLSNPSAIVSVDGHTARRWAVMTVNDDLLEGIKNQMKGHGYTYIGEGDLRPTALANWTPPGIPSGGYGVPGITLLNGARASDLNDLSNKCAALEAQLIAVVDALWARGVLSGS